MDPPKPLPVPAPRVVIERPVRRACEGFRNDCGNDALPDDWFCGDCRADAQTDEWGMDYALTKPN